MVPPQPGTYDALSHLLFKPLPTPGSSGGPIVDEESGAVVGVMVGTRMDYGIDGVHGWGRPAETIFEVSSHLYAVASTVSYLITSDVQSPGPQLEEEMIQRGCRDCMFDAYWLGT